MADLVKTRIPAIKVIKISNNRVIHINDKIFGKLIIKLLNGDGGFVEGCDIQVSGYCGEECFITVPKAWIGKQVVVKYDRDVMARKLECGHIKWPVFVKLYVPFANDGLIIDYASDDTYVYYYYSEE